MAHEYTEDQLFEATKNAARTTNRDWISRFNPKDIRAILDALPDHQDDEALQEQAGVYQDMLDHPFFKDWSISGTSVRDFMMNKLDNAMNQQDDWEECLYRDIRKGDRVKRVMTHDSGTTETREGVAETVDRFDVSCSMRQIITGIEDSRNTIVKLYRIPAPVQHPDPTEHPVIYVRDSDIVGFIPKIMVWYRDSYVAGRQCFSPERITDWQQVDPAKVVADND